MYRIIMSSSTCRVRLGSRRVGASARRRGCCNAVFIRMRPLMCSCGPDFLLSVPIAFEGDYNGCIASKLSRSLKCTYLSGCDCLFVHPVAAETLHLALPQRAIALERLFFCCHLMLCLLPLRLWRSALNTSSTAL